MLNGAVLIEELKAERKIKQIGVFISDERKIRTKTGQAMSFLEISDESGDLSAVVFPDVYRKYLRILKKGAVVLLSGYLEYRKGKEQFVVQEAKDFSELTQPGEGVRLFLRITRYLETKTILEELKSAIRQHPGNTRVVLFYERTNKLIQLSIIIGLISIAMVFMLCATSSVLKMSAFIDADIFLLKKGLQRKKLCYYIK